MEIIDALGLLRPEIYVGWNHSEGTILELHKVHAEATVSEFEGETVLEVRARPEAVIGEMALFAAYLHQTTDQIIKCYDLDSGVADLSSLAIPHMSRAEINQRFAAIKGAGSLNIYDKRQIIDNALLISTHLTKQRYSDELISQEKLQLDDWPYLAGP